MSIDKIIYNLMSKHFENNDYLKHDKLINIILNNLSEKFKQCYYIEICNLLSYAIKSIEYCVDPEASLYDINSFIANAEYKNSIKIDIKEFNNLIYDYYAPYIVIEKLIGEY